MFPLDASSGHLQTILHRQTSASPPLLSSLGNGWRHSFDILITRNEDGFTVFGANGERHRFNDTASVGIGSHDSAAYSRPPGRLSRNGIHHRWVREDGSIVDFTGSLPTSIRHRDSTIQHLNYRNGQLVSVDSEMAGLPIQRQYEFAYEHGRLSHVREWGKRWHEYGFDHLGALSLKPAGVAPEFGNVASASPLPPYRETAVECVAEAPARRPCDTEAVAPPLGFETSSVALDSIRLDVRPSSCNSYFIDFHGTVRGQEIERALVEHDRYAHLQHTVRSFPIIDFLGDGVAYVVRSRDLTSATLSSTQGEPLFNRLMQDGRDIRRKFLDPLASVGTMSIEEGGQTTRIDKDDVEQVVLEIIIRHDTVNTHQIRQIERARKALMDEFGIVLVLIEIP